MFKVTSTMRLLSLQSRINSLANNFSLKNFSLISSHPAACKIRTQASLETVMVKKIKALEGMNIGGYEYWRSKILPLDRVSYIVGRTDQKYVERGTKNVPVDWP